MASVAQVSNGASGSLVKDIRNSNERMANLMKYGYFFLYKQAPNCFMNSL